MQRFTNILFSPLSDHDNAAAARRVAEVATRNEARLTLLGVVPEPSRFQRLIHRAEYFADVQEAERAAAEKRLNRWATHAECPVERATETGNHAIAIIERVMAEGHDLVVVTAHAGHEEHATIERLYRKCPCPVWVIRPSRARVQRVLAAVNPDPDELELNRTVLELSASMVERFGGELHLVHAWELYGEATLRGSGFIHTPADELESLLDAEETSHRRALDDLMTESGLDHLPWKVHLVKGPADQVVEAVVAGSHINLLVMGTVARTGIQGVIIGNTAEQILEAVPCSVIAVKPPGFLSPLDHRPA